jgi:hypothetical protein
MSSDRKGKKRVKTTPSAPATSSSGRSNITCPDNLSFLWKIQAIDTDSDAPPRYLPVGAGKGNDCFKIRFPQNRAKYFTRQPGNLYRWSNGESELIENPPRLKEKDRYQVASVFFLPQQDNFVVSLRDCTREDIAEGELGWAQIMFNNLSPGLSYVEPAAGSKFTLYAPADNTTWMPQVLPEVYNCPRAQVYDGPPGGLCGRLSVLIGMAAFSAEETRAEAVVQTCFGWQRWTKHRTDIGIGRM